MRGSSLPNIAARIARSGEGFQVGCGTGSRWLFQKAMVRWIVRRLASLSAKASKAVGAIKRAVVSGLEMTFESGLALERELQQQLFTSDDAKEGISAYVAKRPAQFTGK